MTTQFLKCPGGTLAYDDVGSGTPVICVPSMGDLRAEYRFLAPKLVEAGYRAINMDVRGHGESSVGWSDYSVAGVGGDIVTLLRMLNAEPAVILGTSMAAGAAVWAAAEAPELISGLILTSAFVRGDGSPLLQLLFGAMIMRPWGAWAWLRYFNTLYPTHKPADFASYSAKLQANLREPGRLEALRAMLLASKRASEDRIPKVKAPVTVIMGGKDPDFKSMPDEGKWVADSLHAPLHSIDGRGALSARRNARSHRAADFDVS